MLSSMSPTQMTVRVKLMMSESKVNRARPAKPRTFFFHFNKPMSKAAGYPRISVHFNKTCQIVDNVVCEVPTHGRIRKTQPVFVMTGKCRMFVIIDNVAYLR